MSSTEELVASLAEAEGQLEAVEAGLTSDPTSEVSFYPLPTYYPLPYQLDKHYMCIYTFLIRFKA